jgi:predicted tellurium resistance membrane protein TerC
LESNFQWRHHVTRSIVVSVLLIALTDVALQLDNALAISSVASGVPATYRLPVLAGGVLLAAGCLFAFTLVGSNLIERIGWLKPVAGLALVVIGAKLAYDYFRS